jgi:hypothetical protein
MDRGRRVFLGQPPTVFLYQSLTNGFWQALDNRWLQLFGQISCAKRGVADLKVFLCTVNQLGARHKVVQGLTVPPKKWNEQPEARHQTKGRPGEAFKRLDAAYRTSGLAINELDLKGLHRKRDPSKAPAPDKIGGNGPINAELKTYSAQKFVHALRVLAGLCGGGALWRTGLSRRAS